MTSYQTISTPQDYVNYTFNISSRGIAEVSGEMVGLSNTVTTILGQLAFKTSEYLTHTESAMIGLGTAAVASFASSTQEAIKFEQAIANVQAIGGESINAMDIGQAAMRYSNQFGMDVNSMTEGLEALSRAGLTATNVMSGVLAEGVKLSKLEGMDLEDSINDLISTTNLLAESQYDVNSQEYADAVKAMNQHIVSTSESAPINAQNIIQTLQHAGGYVSSAKIDQDDLFAVIAQLGSKGTKGEMAGTALRAFIAAGQKDQAQRALSRIGLDVSDLWDESGNIMLPVSEMKQVLDDALEARGYSQQEKLEFYSDFAGYKQANQIMKIDTSEVQEYKKTIEQAWDLGTKLETILGTTHNNIQTLFQTVKNFMTRTGSTILPLINAIIIPIKWGVQLLDAMPFSENIVGMALAFAGLKAAVLFINRVVPSIAGLYTSLSKSSDKAEGIYGHFKNFRKELEQSRDILEHISDKDYLANIRVHQGLMGRQSHIQHKDITKTLYTDVFRRDNPDILPWEELSSTQKELYYSIAETLKNTNAYQNIIDQFNKANEGHVRRFIDAFKNNNENRPKSNLETNKEKHLSQENEYKNLQADNIHKDFVTITGQVREIQNHIYKNIGKENDTQYDVGMGIMSVADKLAAVFVSAFNNNKNKTTNTVDDIKITADKDNINEVVNEVRQLRLEAKSKNLPDIGFAYNYDINKIEKARDNILKDISNVVSSFSNLDVNTMDSTQRSRISKQYSINAMTPRGIFESKLRNTAEVRDIFNGKIYIDPKDSNKGIRKEQLDAIEKVFSITNKLPPDDRIARIQKIQDKYNTLTPNEQHILSEKAIRDAQDEYSDFIANRESPSAMNTSHLEAAKNIFKQFNIDATTLTGENIQDIYNNLSTQQQEYIKDLTFIEQKRNANGVFTESEANQLSMMFEKLAMVEEAYNKLLNIATPELAELDDELKGKFSLSELVFNNAQIGSPGAYESGYSIEDIVEEIISNDKNYNNKNKLKVRDVKNDLSKGYYGGKEFNNNQIDNIIRDATNRIENRQSTHQKSKLNICECFKNGIEKILQKMDSLVSVDAINIQTALLDRLKISLGDTKYYEELEKLKATNEQNIRATEAGQQNDFLDKLNNIENKFDEQNKKIDEQNDLLRETANNSEFIKDFLDLIQFTQKKSPESALKFALKGGSDAIPVNYTVIDKASNTSNKNQTVPYNIEFGTGMLTLAKIIDTWDEYLTNMQSDVQESIQLLDTTTATKLLTSRTLVPTNQIKHTLYPLSATHPNISLLPSGAGQHFQQPFPNFIADNLPTDENQGRLIKFLDDKINTLIEIFQNNKQEEADIKKEMLNIANIITKRENIQKHIGDTNRRLAGKKYRESIANNQYFEPIGPIEKEPTVYKTIALSQGGMVGYEKAYRNYNYRAEIGPQPAPGFTLPQYPYPIGPLEDRGDLAKMAQLKVIEQEKKQKASQEAAKAEADLQARMAIEEEERTKRYNKKMAQRKAINDKRAAENARRFREQNQSREFLFNQAEKFLQEIDNSEQELIHLYEIFGSRITHNYDVIKEINNGIVKLHPPQINNQSPSIEEYKSFAPGLTQYHQYREEQIQKQEQKAEQIRQEKEQQEKERKEKEQELLNEHNKIEAKREINKKWNETKRLRVFGGVIANNGAIQGPNPVSPVQGPNLPTQEDKAKLAISKLKQRRILEEQKFQLYAQLYPNYNDLEKAIYNENKPKYNAQQATPFSYTQKTYTDDNNVQMFGTIVRNLQNQKIIDLVDDNINQYNQKTLDYSGAYQTSNLKTIYNGDLYIKNLKKATQALEMFNDSLNNFNNISQHTHTSKPNIYTLQHAQERFRQGTHTNQDLFTLGISTPSKIEEERGREKSKKLKEEQQGVSKLYQQYNKQHQYMQEFGFVKDFFNNAEKIQQQYDMSQEFNQAQKDMFTLSQRITGVNQAFEDMQSLMQASESYISREEEKKARADLNMLFTGTTESRKKRAEDFDFNPFFDTKEQMREYQLRHKEKLTRGEQVELLGLKASHWKEKTFDQVSKIADQYPKEQAEQYSEAIGGVKDKVEGALGAMKGFNAGLERAAEVFPPFTIAVTAMDTAIQIGEGIVWALNMAEMVLSGTKLFDTLATWGLVTAEQAETLSKAAATIATWGLNVAIAAFEILISGPVLAAIAAIVAAIAILFFWERQHADALKKSQEELKETTAKQGVALSQYKDLKKAREAETDAIKKQQAARKEAIALYELEAARLKKRQAVHDEAEARNDAVWGEYGLRATMQKMGLGFIAGGDFESQYENYEGTTKNIRKVKEDTLGNFETTQEQQYVAAFYDANKMAFAEIDAYKEDLGKLYDVESKLIEKYGSIEDARNSQEFADAVQEFCDATGIQAETAVKYLDWLETENKVNQASKVAEASIAMVRARADAKAAGIDMEYGGFDSENMDDVGRAMVYAQVDQMIKDEKHEMWWTMLWEYLQAIISCLFLNFGEAGKHLQKAEAYQEGVAELEANREQYYQDAMDYYENADRYDYGLGSYSIHADTPFGGAVSSAATQHAENEQQRQYNETGKVMSENEYQAVQTQYQEETFGITEEQLRNQKNQENQKAYEQSKSRSTKNANNTLGQLQNNGAQAHRDALDIIDAIKGKGKAGVVSGLGAGVMSLFDEDNPLFKSLRKKGLRDAFDFMAGEEGTVTEKVVSKGKNIYNEAKAAYGENGLRGVYDYGKQGIKKLGNQGIDFLETKGINIRPYAEKGLDLFRQGKSGAKGLYQSAKAGYAENGIRGALGNIKNSAKSAIYGEAPGMMIMDDGTRVPLGGGKEGLLARGQRGVKNIAGEGRALYQSTKTAYAEGGIGNVLSKGKDALKSTSVGSKITDRIGLAREVNGLAADGVPIARSGLDKAVGVFDGAKAAYAEDGIAGVAKFGKEAGKSGIKGLASDTSGILSKGAEGLKNSYKPGAALGEMASAFNPKNLAGGVGDIAKGLKGGGTLLKGIGKVGGPALMALGPALAFADKASELNPFDGPHYNEDGSEKKALQATGEVMGTTVGAVGGVVGGLEGAAAGAAIGTAILPGIGTAIGAVAGGIAGGWLGDTIFQPIGEAIGGTIGWLGDNLLGGIQNVAGTVWDGLTGAAGGVWDAVSGAASGAWDFLTGGGKGDQPVGGLLGLTPIGMGVNAAAGIWNWLSGGDQKNDPYANVENVGQQKNPKSAGQTQNTIVIKNININTEDDPEKIKSALMNLIIEMQEQVNPRQVSRTVGEPPATSSATTDQNQNNTAQAQGTDPQSGTPNGNSTTNTNTNTNT